jgi:hypothetical protein
MVRLGQIMVAVCAHGRIAQEVRTKVLVDVVCDCQLLKGPEVVGNRNEMCCGWRASVKEPEVVSHLKQ